MQSLKEQSGITGKIKIITTCSKTGKKLRETEWCKNLVMIGTDTGKDLILDRLVGNNAYTLNISHADIGTGNAAPATSDIALQTPVTREAKTISSVASNVASFQFFFPDGDLPNGTYREFGMFIDGSGTISSGKIFNRSLFSVAYTKATNEDTTIQCDITIT